MGLETGVLVQIGLTLVTTAATSAIAQRKQKAAKLAAQRKYEASLGQDVRISAGAQPIDVCYGYTISGQQLRPVYTTTASNFPASATNASINLAPPAGRLPNPNTGIKNQFMLNQWVIGVGQVDQLIDMWTDELDGNDDRIRLSTFGQMLYDQANGYATAFTTERGTTDTFSGLSYVTTVHELDRDDPQYNGIPQPLFFLRGNRVNTYADVDADAVEVFSNNAAWVLLDYLTSDYGAGWSLDDDINLQSFIDAAAICGRVVQSQDGDEIDLPLDGLYPYPIAIRGFHWGANTLTYSEAYDRLGMRTGSGGFLLSLIHISEPTRPY